MNHLITQVILVVLILLECFVGLSSLWGGIKLIRTNGMGMPVVWLDGSPFRSYKGPGIILASIVAGTHLWGSVGLLLNVPYSLEMCAVAGLGLLIWTFVEQYIIRHNNWLQALYFAFALTEIIFVGVYLRLS